jgi:hypothetical protein
VPLSLTIVSGRRPRRPMTSSSSGARRRPDRGVRDERQTFAGAVIDYCQGAEAPAVGQLVGDEVQAPALIGCLRDLSP